MREEDFINSLKQQADGFKVSPSAGLFDKIIVSGNLNNKAAEQDFANMLKEKVSDFSVAPSAGLFDKINAASKTAANAEVEQFNQIVKKHAKDFKVAPSNGLFEKIVTTRNNLLARRYATYGIAAILLLSVSSFFYWLSHSTDALKKDTETVYVSEGVGVDKSSSDQKIEVSKPNTVSEKSVALTKAINALAIKSTTNKSSSKNSIPSQTNQDPNRNNLFVNRLAANATESNTKNSIPEQAKLISSTIDVVSSNSNQNSPINSNIVLNTENTEGSDSKSSSQLSHSNKEIVVGAPSENKPNDVVVPTTTDNSLKPQVNQTSPIATSVNPPLPASVKARKKIVGTKWAVGIYGTPQLLKSEYHSNKTKENWANEYLQTKIQNDKSNFNYQAGLLIERKLSNSFSVISGIGMSQIKFRELRVVTYLTPSEASGTDITISNKEYIRKSSYDVTMNYLEVPLHIQYAKHWNKFSLAVQVGLAYNLLMDANAVVYNSDTMNTCIVQGANKTLQQHVFYFSSAITAEYFPMKQISVFAGPTYRTALNSVYDDKYVLSQKPYFYGLTMGVKYAF